MSPDTVGGFLLCCLLVPSPTGLSPLRAQEPPGVEIIVDRAERLSRDEVHFSLKVSNRSGQPVFLAGINYDSGPVLHPVFLEQWRQKKGWEIVAPCMDMPPPHVIKLNPRAAMNVDLVLKLPLSAICKVRTVLFESKFRFRLEYFDNEKHARAYIDKLPSRTDEVDVKPRLAISETFEIAPTRSREQ